MWLGVVRGELCCTCHHTWGCCQGVMTQPGLSSTRLLEVTKTKIFLSLLKAPRSSPNNSPIVFHPVPAYRSNSIQISKWDNSQLYIHPQQWVYTIYVKKYGAQFTLIVLWMYAGIILDSLLYEQLLFIYYCELKLSASLALAGLSSFAVNLIYNMIMLTSDRDSELKWV